ncbi:conserved hypothetical protein [Theileria orientalis strain Shintoku]|uniref:AP2/ERF domain-containing protein n=1 Tax=Theileria orientalis strain Shintoku TaxID=869250 RepID=J4DPY4_THEOR|nr:conserved hypothetical protein [Theileria orientalis strain Shintoku]BAM41509.1 conserved hypothetical protein [Theileria orientalis strain Shintoku]|eukprot:XP_009691810.1 conserved hypothetical protein [Theileria orientalis strain Shintoku]
MVEASINQKSKTEEKPMYLDSKLSVDSTCSTRVNNSTDFSVYSSDSFDVKTTNVESTRSPASSIEESNNTDPSNRSSSTVKVLNYEEDRQPMEIGQEENYEAMSPEYDYKRKRVVFDGKKREMMPEYVSEEILNKSKYGQMSVLSRSEDKYYYTTGGESSTGEQQPGMSKSLDEIMKNVTSNAYKVYEDDIMELEKCSKKMKYEEEEGYSQFDSNTSTVNSDSNSVADGAEIIAPVESEEVNENGEERSNEARRVFKDIFDPKNWDKSWTIYTKPRKDRSAELVSELYVFMLQLKLLNSLELVRAVCRPWGVPPHGNDYVFHFDQIAGSRDLALLQKYEEVFAPLYGKFKAGSPSVLWTRLADVDYFKIVFKLECIRFKQPFSSTIYENILRYTLSKLHAARSQLGVEDDEEGSPVGDLESLNNKHAMEEVNVKRKVCGVCGNIVKKECSYCASMDSSPSNRILISKVQVSTEEGTSSAFARNGAPKINGKNKGLTMSTVDTGGLEASSVDAVTIEADGATLGEDEMALEREESVREVVESAKCAAGGSVTTAYVPGGREALVNGNRSSSTKEEVNGDVLKERDAYSRGSSRMATVIKDTEHAKGLLGGQRNGVCIEHASKLGRLGGTGGSAMSNGDYHNSDVYALSSDGYYASGKKDGVYEKEYGMEEDEVYDLSLSGGVQVRSVERRKSVEPDGDEWPERRISESEGFILTNFSAGNEYESPNIYKEDIATSFKYSTPSAGDKSATGTRSAGVVKEGAYGIMRNSQDDDEDTTTNDNNTRLISSDLVDASEVDVTTHSNLDFGEHFPDHTGQGEGCGGRMEGERGADEEERKLKEEMVKNAMFRESVLKTNMFKDNPLTEDMLKNLDRDYNYDGYSRGFTTHYKKGEGMKTSENYGLLDEEVLLRDEAILASLDEDMVNSEVTEEESYHQVTDQDIEKIVLSVLNRRLPGEYTKYDQNPLMALYGSKSEGSVNAGEQLSMGGTMEGYAHKGDRGMQAKKIKKKEDDYRNVDKYAYVENKYARMENRYNYMDYTPSYYTTTTTKDKRKTRDLDYEEGYYDDMMQQKQYGASKDKEIKISSHVVSASVSYDKRQQRFMAQWKTREGTKHSKSFYAKRYASPIMARKHAELYKMYILQHRVMNASELVEPTYEQLLANNFKDLDSINVGELDYELVTDNKDGTNSTTHTSNTNSKNNCTKNTDVSRNSSNNNTRNVINGRNETDNTNSNEHLHKKNRTIVKQIEQQGVAGVKSAISETFQQSQDCNSNMANGSCSIIVYSNDPMTNADSKGLNSDLTKAFINLVSSFSGDDIEKRRLGAPQTRNKRQEMNK